MNTVINHRRFHILAFASIMVGLFAVWPIWCAVGEIHYQAVEIDPKTGLPLPFLNTNLDLDLQKIADSTRLQDKDAEKARMVSYDYSEQKEGLTGELLETFKDLNMSKLNHGMAAYYLGELRATEYLDELSAGEVANALAQNITLNLGMETTALYQGLPRVSGPVVQAALIKIGIPAIPAVIRNLAESDDAKVRNSSLYVLYCIENDKDIVKLRLQKALKAEKDPAKQARLQAALRSLAETSFK